MWTMKRLELHNSCAGNPCRMTVWDLSLCPVQEICELHTLEELDVAKDLNQDNFNISTELQFSTYHSTT